MRLMRRYCQQFRNYLDIICIGLGGKLISNQIQRTYTFSQL